MSRGVWAENPEMLFELSWEGVVKRSALDEVGVSGSAISDRSRRGGPWQRLLPGVLLLSNGVPTPRQRLIAALVYAGERAILTGHAALGVHGFSRSAMMQDVQVLKPESLHRVSTGFVVVERTVRMPDAILCQDLPTAPIARAALDACRRLHDKAACRSLLVELVQRQTVTVAELEHELQAGQNRGTAVPRLVIQELAGHAHSVAEVDAQRLYATAGLPPMVWNSDIVDADGVFVARPDGWLDGVALVWEIDSLAHHLSAGDHARTQARQQRLRSLGIVVVVHTPQQCRDHPDLVVAELRAAYQQAKGRPRPVIRVKPIAGT